MKSINFICLLFLIFYSCNNELPIDNSNGNNDVPDDTIYIGGHFTIIGNQAINNIAYWDGENWNSLGSGIIGSNVNIECMVFYKGELYVGGFIDPAGVVPSKNIVKWDGEKWTTVGEGINGRVTSLVVYNDELYAGGWFSNAGGLQTENIAKWNGFVWSSVGEGFSDEVYTLCIYNDELYAGGWFTKNTFGYVNADNIARWNGLRWDSVGSGVSSGFSGGSWIKTFTVYNNELYASGNFSRCGNLEVSNIARWDNNIWQTVYDGISSKLTYASAYYKNELHLSGEINSAGTNNTPYYTIGDGTKWNFNKFTFDGSPYCSFSFNNNLYIGGIFHTINGKLVNGICKWDGTSIGGFSSGVQGYVSSILPK